MLPAFEKAIVGMNINEKKTITIPANEAYGEYSEDMLFFIDKNNFPIDIEPKVGKYLQLYKEGNETIKIKIIDISKIFITLDANHPLAGKQLIFDIELIEIIN